MKIAFVHQPIGGVIEPGRHADSLTILVYEIARRLAASCEVIVYDRRGPGQTEVEMREGIQYRRLSPLFNDDRLLPYLTRLSRFRNPRRPLFASNWYHRSYINRIARDLRQQRCDFVFEQTMPQYPSMIRKQNPTARIALNMQCEWLNQLDRRMISRQLEAVDLVLGCSDYITQQVRAALPEHAGRCRTLLNGCDVNRFQSMRASDSGPKRLLFMGRVSPEKGVHVLIEAFRQVAERYPEAELDVVGPEGVADRSFIVDISNDHRVRELSRYYGSSYLAALKKAVPPTLVGRVRFSGVVPHEQTPKYYAEASAFVCPSVCEAFGLPVIEAMASGLPVIASSTGGIPELVTHGKTGLLVPPNDPQALASAISRLLDDPDLCRRMAQAGRERVVSKFSWERVVDDLSGYLREFTCSTSLGTVTQTTTQKANGVPAGPAA